MSEDIKSLSRIVDKVEDIQKDVYQVRIDMAEHKVLVKENTARNKLMHDSLNKVEEHLDRFDSHLMEYNKQLEIHIAGVRGIEDANRIDRERLEIYKLELDTKMKNLETPQTVIKGILWLAGAIAVIGSAVKLFLS